MIQLIIMSCLGQTSPIDPDALLRHTSIDGDVTPIVETWLQPRPLHQPRTTARGPSSSILSVDDVPDGDMPRDLAFSPDGTKIVIVNRDTDNVAIMDASTRNIEHMVDVGDFPVHVAISDDGRAFVPNVISNSVSVIDLATGIAIAEVPVSGDEPFQIALLDDVAIVAVINDAVNSQFSVIDLDTLTEVRAIPTSGQGAIGGFGTPESGTFGNLFSQFAVTGRSILLPDGVNDVVNVYDVDTGAQTDTLFVDEGPWGIDVQGDTAVVAHFGNAQRLTRLDLDPAPSVGAAFSTNTNVDRLIRVTPDGTEAVCSYLNDVYFVDLATGAETGRVSTGVVGDLLFTSDGSSLVVPNFNLRVIDLATKSVVRTLQVASCYDGAASPVDGRVAALNNRFREDVQVYQINGASSTFEGLALTGPAEEGDAPRDLAVRGTTVIACHNTSRNASIIRDGMVEAYIEVGERPLGAAITPDGRWGVICGTDDDRVTIVDLQTDTIVKTLTVPTRPTSVRISPDGAMAWVLTIAGTDRIAFIELDGANSTLVGSVPSGQTGSWYGVPFSAFSAIEATNDGSILAVCASFDNVVRLIDTATMTTITDIPVGDFPFRIAFTDDDSTAYVSNAFGSSVSVIDMNTNTVIRTIGTNQYPNEIAVSGSHAYVATQQSGGKRVHVIDTATNTIVRNVNVEPHAHTAMLPEADEIVLAGTGSTTVPAQLLVIDATGVTETFDLAGQPSDVVSDGRTYATYPATDLIEFEAGRTCDWNGDTEVNIFDVIDFLADFDAGDPIADFNGDTVLDIFDVLKILECF